MQGVGHPDALLTIYDTRIHLAVPCLPQADVSCFGLAAGRSWRFEQLEHVRIGGAWVERERVTCFIAEGHSEGKILVLQCLV